MKYIFAEPTHIHSTTPNMLKPNTPLLNQRKKPDLDADAKNDQAKPGKLKYSIKTFHLNNVKTHYKTYSIVLHSFVSHGN